MVGETLEEVVTLSKPWGGEGHQEAAGDRVWLLLLRPSVEELPDYSTAEILRCAVVILMVREGAHDWKLWEHRYAAP